MSICDELFAANKERFEQFIERIAPYNLEWYLPMRADSIKNPEVFKKAYAAGCREMQVGLESGCDAILKSMRKGTSKAMLRDLYKNANEYGISIMSSMIFGDVAETMETVEESFAFAKELGKISPKVRIGMYPIKLYPGSPLYNDAKINKKIVDTTKHILAKIPFVNVSKMSDEEYNFLVKRILPAMLTSHFVRTTIGRQKPIDRIRQIDEDPFEKSYTYLNIFDIDLDDKSYYLSYTCPKCNTRFYTTTKEITYGLDFEDNSFCPACQCEKHIKNKIYRAMLLDDGFFERVKPVLMKLLVLGNVGVAGMGAFFSHYRLEFKKLFDGLEMTSKNRFILSDSNSSIADHSVVAGRKIYHTENVLDKVKSIVVPSVYYPQIREMVASKELNIKVFGFFELPFHEKNEQFTLH